jgi:hypothetical protein
MIRLLLRYEGLKGLRLWRLGEDNIWDSFDLVLDLMTFLNKLINNRAVRKRSSSWSPFGF